MKYCRVAMICPTAGHLGQRKKHWAQVKTILYLAWHATWCGRVCPTHVLHAVKNKKGQCKSPKAGPWMLFMQVARMEMCPIWDMLGPLSLPQYGVNKIHPHHGWTSSASGSRYMPLPDISAEQTAPMHHRSVFFFRFWKHPSRSILTRGKNFWW